MPNAITLGENPMPEDYKGSVADKSMNVMTNGSFEPDGDKEKAIKAIYEVVMGEGVGAGHQGERFLPLGRDLAKRVDQVQVQYRHSMQIFGEVCNGVYKEKGGE